MLCAAALISSKGFEQTSMNDIANDVGITKPGLYHYFPSKEAIYDALVADVLQDMLEHVTASVAAKRLAAEKLKAFMTAHARFYQTRREAFHAAFMGRGGLATGYNEEQTALRRTYSQALHAIIREGVASREFTCGDPENLARGLLGMLNWMARWYDTGGVKSAEEIAEFYADTILIGLTRSSSVNPLTAP